MLFGPGDVRRTHASDEWVPIADLAAVTRALVVTILRFCGIASPRADVAGLVQLLMGWSRDRRPDRSYDGATLVESHLPPWERRIETIVTRATRLLETELPMRRISRRPEGEDSLRDAAILLRTVNRLRGKALIPKGVYRFSSHEEAEEWTMRQIAATHARQSSKTS